MRASTVERAIPSSVKTLLSLALALRRQAGYL
jgi:hypothetical protein